MSKGSKNINRDKKAERDKTIDKSYKAKNEEYLFNMSHAPALGETSHWFQMVPVLFFTAVIIMITRMAAYDRPMKQFFFWSGNDKLNDFFSYYKMTAILVCALLVLVFLLYRVFIQSFYIKRSFAYIPMAFYSVFVLLSYSFSDYKKFALLGWNDRFEGTLVLISYMIILFYVINSVNSEKNVKWIIYTLAVVSSILGMLGITQALNHDFFRTAIGKMLITPRWFWDQIDSLDFTFTDQIYQTVYNINYVSFYLTLLIPIFGILFIRSVMQGKEESIVKKIAWGALFSLLIFNLIGSASSGGLMGMAFVVLMAIFVLNKNIIKWWKPITILLVLTVIIAGISFERWMPELSGAVDSISREQTGYMEAKGVKHKIDYMETFEHDIYLGYEGEEIVFTTYPDDPASLTVTDSNGASLALSPTNVGTAVFQLEDERFNWISVKPAKDDEGKHYVVLITDGNEWPFQLTGDGPKYRTGTGQLINLHKIPAVGWEDNQSFGSGRGYIWSRTIPMLKDALILGRGADTYCIYFPNEDYVGKYNSGTFSSDINIIVDKPHNMYFGSIIGTGCISMLALLALWGIYLIQSFNIYRKERYTSFVSYVGAGIFLGICGFLVSGLVNDSTVSVMPMFYGLLGTGIAINMMLKRQLSR